MKQILFRTPGELIDEGTKQLVREERTGVKTPASAYVDMQMVIVVGGIPTDVAIHGWLELLDLNGKIWDWIDKVTAFDVNTMHTVDAWRDCVMAAQRVQTFNRQRTDKIREIDRLCGVEPTVPEKIHKGIQ